MAMSEVRQVKLFRNGRNQAVRIPKEFELPGDAATMRREGNRLIIEQKPSDSFDDLAMRLAAISAQFPNEDDEFPEIAELPHTPVEL